ncbi:MAG: NAD(P)H-binding protein [candidate division Zixibacteria bacterium]|nr:NAD(P)H-binding protein [candidate division Zixibacteria bacterium]
MNEKILIVGGTGMLGRPVAEKLKEDDFKVTVMSSNPVRAKELLGDKFRLVPGDVTDIQSLRRAFENQEYIFINLASGHTPEGYQKIEVEGTANAARAAKELGIKKIGMISGASSKGVEKGVPFLDAKVRAEKALMDSGIPYIIMRPSWFFESLPLFIRSGRASIIGKQPYPLNWLAASDYARQVSNAFQKDEALNKCFYSLGPEKLTMLVALTRFCERFYPELKPGSISFFTARLLSLMPGMKRLKPMLPFFRHFDETEEDVDGGEADRLLSPNLTTLEEWLDGYRQPSN